MRRLLLFLVFSIAMMWSVCASAHDEMVSASRVEVTERAIVWRVDVGIDGLRKVVTVPDGDLDETAVDSLRASIEQYLLRSIQLDVNGRPVAGEARGVDVVYEPSMVTGAPRVARIVVEMEFVSPEAIRTASARLALFASITSQHRAVIDVRRGGQSSQVVRVGPTAVDLGPLAAKSSTWQEARAFAGWGIRHILSGYDHIAFLLALLLATARWRDVVKIITAFTLAHSLTLLLSALQIVHLPTRLTEAMIAASIVYVAAENMFGSRSRPHRWLLAFGFGLVHGLGFASGLRERLAESGHVLLPVLSFNVGVEIGQLAIVATVLPILSLVRGMSGKMREGGDGQRFFRAASFPILAVGTFWLVQRGLG